MKNLMKLAQLIFAIIALVIVAGTTFEDKSLAADSCGEWRPSPFGCLNKGIQGKRYHRTCNPRDKNVRRNICVDVNPNEKGFICTEWKLLRGQSCTEGTTKYGPLWVRTCSNRILKESSCGKPLPQT